MQQNINQNQIHIGAGMDCAVIPLARYKEYFLVQSVDFFYPLIDDPKTMGSIAFANVVSDIYAVGITDLDKISMLISAPTSMSESDTNKVVPMIMEGFFESARLADCEASVQNIMLNPWCIVGGTASAVSKHSDIIMPCNAKDGDLIVLTKPLGTQLATNAFIWMQEQNEKYKTLSKQFSDQDIEETYKMAIKSMCFLNKNAAILMHKHGAHAATDITGFGLLGHAENLAQFQKDTLSFKIKKLPILKNILQFSEILSQDVKLKAGKAVETSGGLFICLSGVNALAFCKDFEEMSNGEQCAWIVGHVESSKERAATLVNVPEYIEVSLKNV